MFGLAAFAAPILLGVFAPFGLIVPLQQLISVLLATLIFVILGLVIFALAYFIIVKVSPFSVRKEIEDDQNTALAIVIGSVIIGVAIIIAAAIQGN